MTKMSLFATSLLVCGCAGPAVSVSLPQGPPASETSGFAQLAEALAWRLHPESGGLPQQQTPRTPLEAARSRKLALDSVPRVNPDVSALSAEAGTSVEQQIRMMESAPQFGMFELATAFASSGGSLCLDFIEHFDYNLRLDSVLTEETFKQANLRQRLSQVAENFAGPRKGKLGIDYDESFSSPRAPETLHLVNETGVDLTNVTVVASFEVDGEKPWSLVYFTPEWRATTELFAAYGPIRSFPSTAGFPPDEFSAVNVSMFSDQRTVKDQRYLYEGEERNEDFRSHLEDNLRVTFAIFPPSIWVSDWVLIVQGEGVASIPAHEVHVSWVQNGKPRSARFQVAALESQWGFFGTNLPAVEANLGPAFLPDGPGVACRLVIPELNVDFPGEARIAVP